MHQLIFYVPESHLEVVKSAVFDAGGGRIGDYDRCCWQCQGEGQFRPLPGSTPHLGAVDTLERVVEYKVELVCEDAVVADVVAALRSAHPYEEPAYSAWRLADL